MIVTGETLNGTSSRERVVRERLVVSARDVASVRQFVAGALDKEMPAIAKCSESLQIGTAQFVLVELRVRGLSRQSRHDFAGIGVRAGGLLLLGAELLWSAGREARHADGKAVRL
jgi:hypothetical protein